MRSIITRKTSELSHKEIEEIVEGFNLCFPKHSTTVEELLWKYKANHFSESYHALCYDDEELVGFISAIPYRYKHQDKIVIIALTCDIFIKEEARADFTLFAQLYKNLNLVCQENDVICFLGVANNNAYTYSIRILRCKELFTLPYWILPVRIGNVVNKKGLKFLNVFSIFYSYLTLWINQAISFIFNHKAKESFFNISIDIDYLQKRLPNEKYINQIKGDCQFSYRITNDEGVKCAYIMICTQEGRRSYKALCRCVSFILDNEKVDMIMFNGTLNVKQGLLIKTPSRLEPRKLHLTIHFLNKEYEQIYSDIFKSNGLDFSLINLDVR